MGIRVREGFCALFMSAAMASGLCILFTSTMISHAQTNATSSWIGVWRGELEGIPSVILTLAADGGTLQGTLVLNGINGEGGTPHIAVRETHVLLHPTLSGMKLSFSVRGVRGSSNTMEFTVDQTSDNGAKIHCLTCGEDAPVVEITKED
jgi:hypothetical protein